VINISFISQEKTLFEGEAKMVVMDGQDGQLGIVQGHSPLLAILKPGPVRMIQDSGEEVFFTNGGFAEVQPESITILVDSAVRADDLEVSSQLNQSLSQLRAIEALKKNVKLKS
jgi:F-type H+-transporting ATPase subunit epsilon